MKKSLLAVAVAAALPVVAHAQVTLSGRIDTSVQSQKTTAGVSSTGMGSSLLTTNQIVLSGSEDLGGGLRANFIINSQFSTDQKALLDFGHRGVGVGLSGGFGAVELGRSSCTTLCSIAASGLIGNPGNLSTDQHTIRPDNSVTYTTPSMSGLQAKVVLGLEESKATGKEITEFALLYAAGPLSAQFAYVDEKGTASQFVAAGFAAGAAAATAASTAGAAIAPGKHMGLRVNYNAGFATLHVRYQDVDRTDNTGDRTEYGVGALIPLAGGRSVLLDYRSLQPNSASPTDQTRVAAALVQDLSKRTNVYAIVWNDKKDKVDDLNEGTFFAVGVRHNF